MYDGITHLVIDSTELKVFGESEWKAKTYGQEKRRVWRKLYLAVNADTHEVMSMIRVLKNDACRYGRKSVY